MKPAAITVGTLRGRWGTERGTPQREPGPELRPAGPAPPPRPSSQTAPAPGEGAGGRGEAPAGRTVRALELACWGTGAWELWLGTGGPEARAQGPGPCTPLAGCQTSGKPLAPLLSTLHLTDGRNVPRLRALR